MDNNNYFEFSFYQNFCFTLPNQNKILLRDFNYKQALEDWKIESRMKEIDTLRSIFEDLLLGKDSKYILFEKGQGHEAVLYQHLNKLSVNVSFMLDFLRGKVIGLRYYNYLSDTKTEFLDGGNKLSYERHFLKPIHGIRPNEENSHHFGNVLLENCIPNKGDNIMLKIMVTPYPNVEVKPFPVLMKILLS